MNLLEADLMQRPSLILAYCPVCGSGASAPHHVVLRSHGGHEGPQMSLCCECHDKVHRRGSLHFRWRDGWECLEVQARYIDALDMDGWTHIGQRSETA